jgi:hypothetical protein
MFGRGLALRRLDREPHRAAVPGQIFFHQNFIHDYDSERDEGNS